MSKLRSVVIYLVPTPRRSPRAPSGECSSDRPSPTAGGVDYEESLAARLAGLLHERDFATGRDVELISAGAPPRPPAPQLRWFWEASRDYEPDLLIQFVYGSMAVSNKAAAKTVFDEDGYRAPKTQTLGGRLRQVLRKLATLFYGWIVYLRPAGGDDDGRVVGAGGELVQAEVVRSGQPRGPSRARLVAGSD